MVPEPSRGGTEEVEGEETSGSENEICLVAAGQPAICFGESRLPGMAAAAMQALRRLMATTSSRDDLTLMVQEHGPQRRTM
jgi:7-keto-8-aminopelargonate synthetase-like enzyme